MHLENNKVCPVSSHILNFMPQCNELNLESHHAINGEKIIIKKQSTILSKLHSTIIEIFEPGKIWNKDNMPEEAIA